MPISLASRRLVTIIASLAIVGGGFVLLSESNIKDLGKFKKVASAYTNNGAPKAEVKPGQTNVLVLDLTLPGPKTDTYLDCDGTATAGSGCPRAADPVNAWMFGYQYNSPATLCANTNGTTPPTNLVYDTDGACTDADTKNEKVILGGNEALFNLRSTPDTSRVRFMDKNTNAVWDDGEDFFFDADNSWVYNAHVLQAITLQNKGTAEPVKDTSNEGDISVVKLWRESNGNNMFDAGDSVLGSDGVCSWDYEGGNGWVCNDGVDYNYQATAPLRVYVTVDIAPNAKNGRNIQMSVPAMVDMPPVGMWNGGDAGVFFFPGQGIGSDSSGPSSPVVNRDKQLITR